MGDSGVEDGVSLSIFKSAIKNWAPREQVLKDPFRKNRTLWTEQSGCVKRKIRHFFLMIFSNRKHLTVWDERCEGW